MLNPSDVYVSGGSNNLLACWTDKVTKYDASSFYNWEQDNLPLHDLDERTHLLWEKFGHPTSALTGMSFIVSADATSSCNPLYFTTLSACVDALPEVINYPILVEVASFGSLGGLNLSNKSFGPHGSLEIVNRNMGAQSGRNNQGAGFGTDIIDTDANNGLASALLPGGTSVPGYMFSNPTASAVPTIAFDVMRARMFTRDENDNEIFISSSTGTEYADTRYVNPYVFSKRIAAYFNRLTASLSSTIDPWPTSPTVARELSALRFEAFDKTPTTEMATYDVSTLNYLTDSEIVWGDTTDGLPEASRAAAGVVYFNYLDYIKIKNCDGPIYIRNFNVDAQHNREYGIEVVNSNINFEKTAVSRSNKAGLYAKNSFLNLARGFISYRNYQLSGTTRTGIPFANKRQSYEVQKDYGAGIYAIDSTLSLSSTYHRYHAEYLKYLNTDASSLYSEYLNGKTDSTASAEHYAIPNPTSEEIYCFSRNDIGIHCVNSNLLGGIREIDYISGTGSVLGRKEATVSQLFLELNTEAGARFDNSVVDYDGRLTADGNYFGIDATNSKINSDTVAIRYNQSVGLKLTNSEFVYNKDGYALGRQDDKDYVETGKVSQVACIENGQDVYCEGSVIRPTYVSSMPLVHSNFFTSGSFGKEEQTDKLLPSIHLKSNSDADLIHARLLKSPAGATNTSQYGLLARVEDNSTLCARGSKEYANMMVGPLARADSVNVAGLYANNGSTIKLQGPTSMFRLGVDVLAENNSNIEITPHQSSNGELLVSAFDLSSGENHTMVELHSTRACLVANRNSNILMENLGDYYDKWLTSPYASGALATPGYRFKEDNYAEYASGGYVQFYPNANLVALDSDSAAANNAAITGTAAYQFNAPGAGSMVADYIYNASPVSSVTTGGMCVRAVENSLVKATNVHFPQEAFPNTSSVAYDYYGTDPLPGPNCTRLFIWNIADNSTLESSYVSVSGTHPRNIGFYGPSGVWGNVSGAPSSTPDTSSLSILDYYGQSSENPYGKSASGENYGCFRLFFSTDPAANFLVASGTNRLQGLAKQVFAQGYNFSGNLLASATDEFTPSAQYTTVLQRDDNGNINASGFYYASAMMAGANSIKAFLDDSALNTFANAKHNTVGKSGLAKVVEGYYDINNVGGDSYNLYPYGQGMASINNFDLKKDN